MLCKTCGRETTGAGYCESCVILLQLGIDPRQTVAMCDCNKCNCPNIAAIGMKLCYQCEINNHCPGFDDPDKNP